eukprot:TRINITY_DN44223_c0_g1_i1.p1 TRINITY_DN44223_c0_g1~~TRINITY_DN44223_c0_g1_i1.p1  ORF type:complete len:891 (+),score=172.24 TRINITY_DN44223_c0_g1_i1:105-2675(+)
MTEHSGFFREFFGCCSQKAPQAEEVMECMDQNVSVSEDPEAFFGKPLYSTNTRMDRVLSEEPEGFHPPSRKGSTSGSVTPSIDAQASDVLEIGGRIDFIGEVKLFKRLPQDQLPRLGAAFSAQDFEIGEVVIRQGDMGSEFFVIKSGEASVNVASEETAKGMQVATLKAGDYFGENALLRDEPRSATITAETKLCTFKIAREKFQSLDLIDRIHFPNRKAVGGGCGMAGRKAHTPKKDQPPKTEQERALIGNALKSNGNLSVMATLTQEQLTQLADVAWQEKVPKGSNLIKEGDLQADHFYIVQEGCFEIYVSSAANSASAEQAVMSNGNPVSTVSRGGSFGELALMYLVPRAATVQAQVDSTVWVIHRLDFKNILLKHSEGKVSGYEFYLSKVPVLKSLYAEEKKALARAMQELLLQKGDMIIQQGVAGKTFYVLIKGRVSCIREGVEKKLSADGATYTFGSRSLLGETADATVEVSSDTAEVLAVDRETFEMLLGPLGDIIKASEGGQKRKPFTSKRISKVHPKEGMQMEKQRFRMSDLTRVGLLGCGGFGVVELWEHDESGRTFALKGLSKGYVVQTGMQNGVVNEKSILLLLNSDFIIKLYEAFNSPQMLYFLMEAALGGEVYATYNRKGFHGSEKHCKFYAAGVVLAFEHLHSKKVIYRDLKPENLLITETGRSKLTDMGLATVCLGKSYTTCGTPDYFAPEMIASVGHSNAVDWWTLGILIFELMSGHPPFESATPMQIYCKVMKGIGRAPFPRSCQGAVGDLLKALLTKEPSARLPMRPGGINNIKDHIWYKDFDWTGMMKHTITVPYKPRINNKRDITNFTASVADMPPMMEYIDDGSGWDADFATTD